MKKIDLSKVAKEIELFTGKHAPEILTGIGIAGMVTTVVLAVKETPKACQLLDERKDELKTENLPGVEIVKTTWKCYIPAAVTGVASIACIIGANSVHNKRTAAIAAAYKISETALSEYKDKVVEVVGEKKEQAVRDAIDKDHIQNNPVSKQQVFITTKGESLCYDAHSGRYFKSDIEQIRRAVNNLNHQMTAGDMYCSLNDFYDEIGLSHTDMGDELGWSIEDGLLDIDFGSQITDDGEPCIVLHYNISPKYNYYTLT